MLLTIALRMYLEQVRDLLCWEKCTVLEQSLRYWSVLILALGTTTVVVTTSQSLISSSVVMVSFI